MGLELGPPWLVIALPDGSDIHEVIYKDNFTGAGLRRAISVRKNEFGSYAAVMDQFGYFAKSADGCLFDPIEDTKGRHFGTHADRAYNAYLIAQSAFKRDPRHVEAVRLKRINGLFWIIKRLVLDHKGGDIFRGSDSYWISAKYQMNQATYPGRAGVRAR